MNTRRIQTFFILLQVQHFLQAIISKLGINLGTLPASLAEDVAEVTRRRRDRCAALAGARAARADISVLRDSLWERSLKPIVRTAHDRFAHVPELAALVLPARDASIGALIHSAYALADVVTRHPAHFPNAGLGAYMPEHLRTVAASLERRLAARDQHQRDANDATTAIDIHTRRGLETVRQLDLVLSAELVRQPLTRRAWKAALRRRPITRAELRGARRRAA